MIEGAYARAGLASDIEVIEDYPSHYDAYNRRKHRWLRGDWQIAGWLFPHVPEESADRVPNPISLISRWKILDNLRRSLVEPATFLLLVVGWFMFGRRPWQWTLAAICIVFVPAWFRFAFNLVRAVVDLNSTVARDALSEFYAANVNLLFTLIFLPHQTMLSVDAVVRTLVRRFVTRRRLLEWETAAETDLHVSQARIGGRVSQLGAGALHRVGTSGLGGAASVAPGGAASLIALGLQQTGFLVAESSSSHGAKSSFRERRDIPSARGSAHLAIFRRVQYRGAQLVDTR